MRERGDDDDASRLTGRKDVDQRSDEVEVTQVVGCHLKCVTSCSKQHVRGCSVMPGSNHLIYLLNGSNLLL